MHLRCDWFSRFLGLPFALQRAIFFVYFLDEYGRHAGKAHFLKRLCLFAMTLMLHVVLEIFLAFYFYNWQRK